jgi:hypothetical protein
MGTHHAAGKTADRAWGIPPAARGDYPRPPTGRISWPSSPPPGRWEALDEAWIMTNLVIRHVEGVLEFARHDEVLIAPAWACARSAMEIAARVRWLLEPTDAYEREGRWLARLEEDERFLRASAEQIASAGGDATWLLRDADGMRDFRIAVTAKLPAGTAMPKRIPSALSTMADDPSAHWHYRQASQYVHGTHAGGGLFRRHLGTLKELGEQVSTASWSGPLRASWSGLVIAASASISAIGGAPWPQRSLVARVEAALRAVSDASSDQKRPRPGRGRKGTAN